MISVMSDAAHHPATSVSPRSSPSPSHTTAHRVRGVTSSEDEAEARRKLAASTEAADTRSLQLLPCAILRVDMTSNSDVGIRSADVKIEVAMSDRALRVNRNDMMVNARLPTLLVKKKKSCVIVVILVSVNLEWVDVEIIMPLLLVVVDHPGMEEVNIEAKAQVIAVVAQDPRKVRSGLKKVTVATTLVMIVVLLRRHLGRRDTVVANLAVIMESRIAVILDDRVVETATNHLLLHRIW